MSCACACAGLLQGILINAKNLIQCVLPRHPERSEELALSVAKGAVKGVSRNPDGVRLSRRDSSLRSE